MPLPQCTLGAATSLASVDKWIVNGFSAPVPCFSCSFLHSTHRNLDKPILVYQTNRAAGLIAAVL